MDITLFPPLLPIPFHTLESRITTIYSQVEPSFRDSVLIPYYEDNILPQMVEIKASPHSTGLLFIHDAFRNSLFELLEQIKPFLFVQINEDGDYIESYGLSWDEAYRTLPGYYHSELLVGEQAVNILNEYYFSLSTTTLELEEVRLILAHLTTKESEAAAEELGFSSLRRRVCEQYHQLCSFTALHDTTDSIITAVYEIYSAVGSICFMAVARIYKDYSYFTHAEYVPSKEVLIPILQLREYQEMQEKFSCNDLTTEELRIFATQIFELQEPKDRILEVLLEEGLKELKKFGSLADHFIGSPFSDSFFAAEKEWHQRAELLYMTLGLMPGVVRILWRDELVKEYENSDHAAAKEELIELSFGEDSVERFENERGKPVDQTRWEKIRQGFSRHESQYYMNVVGVENLFDEACAADDDAISLASLICSPELLREFRISRAELMDTALIYKRHRERMITYSEMQSESCEGGE